jgi:membrane protein DedA with SNARE-associated domain
METVLTYICEHASHAHWIIFCLLLLSGLSIPISEDVLLLGGGAIASTCIPDHAVHLYLWIFFGSLLAAYEAYWIGRILGPKLYDIRLFSLLVTPHRVRRLQYYFSKFGIFTFIVGRFCPGGVRNTLFMTSGFTKMPFSLFMLRDGFACLLSTFVLFSIGYFFGQNIDKIVLHFQRYSEYFIAFFCVLATAGLTYYWLSRKRD